MWFRLTSKYQLINLIRVNLIVKSRLCKKSNMDLIKENDDKILTELVKKARSVLISLLIYSQYNNSNENFKNLSFLFFKKQD